VTSERVVRIASVAALLYVIASFVSCSSMHTVRPMSHQPSASGCTRQGNWVDSSLCEYSADCSKIAKMRWPVCREEAWQLCVARKPITNCFGVATYDPKGNRWLESMFHDCYQPAGTSNCLQLWAYEP